MYASLGRGSWLTLLLEYPDVAVCYGPTAVSCELHSSDSLSGASKVIGEVVSAVLLFPDI